MTNDKDAFELFVNSTCKNPEHAAAVIASWSDAKGKLFTNEVEFVAATSRMPELAQQGFYEVIVGWHRMYCEGLPEIEYTKRIHVKLVDHGCDSIPAWNYAMSIVGKLIASGFTSWTGDIEIVTDDIAEALEASVTAVKH